MKIIQITTAVDGYTGEDGELSSTLYGLGDDGIVYIQRKIFDSPMPIDPKKYRAWENQRKLLGYSWKPCVEVEPPVMAGDSKPGG